MKRILVASILGIAASVATSYGQGVISFGNYDANPAFANAVTVNGGAASANSDGGVISLWAGQGVLSNSSLLQQIATTPLFTTLASGSGWYDMAISLTGLGYAQIPSSIWSGTQTVTFQIRGSGTGSALGASFSGATALWQETPDTAGGSIDPSTPNQMLNGPLALDLTSVPEPSILALAGLGAAGMIFRKRQ
jgi:hypothetical protein